MNGATGAIRKRVYEEGTLRSLNFGRGFSVSTSKLFNRNDSDERRTTRISVINDDSRPEKDFDPKLEKPYSRNRNRGEAEAVLGPVELLLPRGLETLAARELGSLGLVAALVASAVAAVLLMGRVACRL